MDYNLQKFEVTFLFLDVLGVLDSFYNPFTVSEGSSVSFPVIALSICENLVVCEGLFQSSYHFLPCNCDSLLEILELISQREMNIAHLGYVQNKEGIKFQRMPYQHHIFILT
jgi:hypothetical protein